VSYNGSGVFNINTAGQPVVTGTVISSTAFNALTADLGTGLSTAITKDGQTTATARIPFAQGINSSLVTDATSTTTGSIITAGGAGIAKSLYVGLAANIAGGVDKLTSATGVVSVAAATAPTTGQVLMATSGTVATWQTPASTPAATPTVLGTVYGSMTTSGGTPFLTALGYNAAPSNTGVNNTAVGASALFTNSTSTNNTALGYQASYGGTLSYNVAIGTQALYTGGNNDNVAIGYRALYTEGNTGNGQNVAIGSSASKVSTASAYNNVSIGYNSAVLMTTGVANVIVGAASGANFTTGNSVVIVGQGAGAGLTTGGSGTYIGANATASSGSVGSEIVIGTGGGPTGKGASTGYIYPNGGGVYQGNNSASWSVTSDQRLKKNIVDNNIGLEKIAAIQVRNFEYRLPEEVDAELKPTDAIQKEGVQLGVIAQELQAVLPECVKTESTGVMSVNADNLTWYLVNAIKELDAKFETYKSTHP